MSGTKSNDDCYFYFYSTCTKGDKCPFRHCEAALGKEVVCTLWKDGNCFRDNCQFRHMECKKNRSQIPCYWENQPGGCRKPHCVFLHLRPRSPNHSTFAEMPGTETPYLASGYIGSAAQQASHLAAQQMPGMPQGQPGMEEHPSVMDTSAVTQPIEPVVVNFDDQESDTESTPVKQPLRERHSQLDSSATHALKEIKDEEIGVKTLEQIRLERIHKESPNFYETTPVIGSATLFALDEAEEDEQDICSVDLRKHLKRKLGNTPVSDLIGAEKNKRFVKLKTSEDEDVNFHIKTLDEIRKEKENRKAVHPSPNEDGKTEVEESVKENSGSKKRRINRLIKVDAPSVAENVCYTKDNFGKNGDVQSVEPDTKTDVLNQHTTFRRRIIKRKSDEIKSVAEKRTKSDEKAVLVNCTSNGSNGINILGTPNLDAQQAAISSSSDHQTNNNNGSSDNSKEVFLPAPTEEEKLMPMMRKTRDRSTSLGVGEDDLDFLLDEDDTDDVPEDKTDDVLLQELEEIINS